MAGFHFVNGNIGSSDESSADGIIFFDSENKNSKSDFLSPPSFSVPLPSLSVSLFLIVISFMGQFFIIFLIY